MTKTKVPKGDTLVEELEKAVLDQLRKTEGKERNDAIAHGIKLAAVKHRIARNEDDGDFFGSES